MSKNDQSESTMLIPCSLLDCKSRAVLKISTCSLLEHCLFDSIHALSPFIHQLICHQHIPVGTVIREDLIVQHLQGQFDAHVSSALNPKN